MKFASQLNDLNGGQYVCWHWFEYKFCELLNAKLSLNDAHSMAKTYDARTSMTTRNKCFEFSSTLVESVCQCVILPYRILICKMSHGPRLSRQSCHSVRYHLLKIFTRLDPDNFIFSKYLRLSETSWLA